MQESWRNWYLITGFLYKDTQKTKWFKYEIRNMEVNREWDTDA